MLLALFDRLRQAVERRSMPAHLAEGRRGEDIAMRYLQAKKYVVIDRNYRTPTGSGEIDLIAWDGGQLVFVEVKTRTSAEVNLPDRAADEAKLNRVRRAATSYLREARLPASCARLDLVSIILSKPVEIRHMRDILGGQRS